MKQSNGATTNFRAQPACVWLTLGFKPDAEVEDHWHLIRRISHMLELSEMVAARIATHYLVSAPGSGLRPLDRLDLLAWLRAQPELDHVSLSELQELPQSRDTASLTKQQPARLDQPHLTYLQQVRDQLVKRVHAQLDELKPRREACQ